MSIVYGNWVFTLLWLGLFYSAPVQNFGVGFQRNVFLKLTKTSGQLFSTELVRSLRMQSNMRIGVRLLRPELFGFYSFANSAGVGLSQLIMPLIPRFTLIGVTNTEALNSKSISLRCT